MAPIGPPRICIQDTAPRTVRPEPGRHHGFLRDHRSRRHVLPAAHVQETRYLVIRCQFTAAELAKIIVS